MKCYLEELDKTTRTEKWEFLLQYAFSRADSIEFNILFRDRTFIETQDLLKESIEGVFSNKEKLYQSGEVIRFRLTDQVKDFLRSRNFDDWKNFCLEDVSFYKGDFEFLGTVSHEDYVIIKLSGEERRSFIDRGFTLEVLWNKYVN